MTSAHVADEIAAQLNNSGSATIYVDIAGISQDVQILADSDPPLHVEFDVVRQLYAVRRATDDEVAEATTDTSESASSAY